MPSPDQRKLAAIVFTDMVGFSALSQRDEAVALELLEEHRALIRGFLAAQDGREVKAMGDGFLLEFPSALAAVRTAVEIQQAFHDRNQALPAKRQVRVRIGIHVGDVVAREGDIHGDGVNIAARLEPLAPAGGICVSEDVARAVRNKLPQPLERLGPAELKNIDLPMAVYRVTLPWTDAIAGAPKRAAWVSWALCCGALLLLALALSTWRTWRAREAPAAVVASVTPTAASAPALPAIPEKSIAVLPFDNLSKDEENAFFANGMQDEILTDLARVADLKVISRSSVMHYKTGVERKIREIGKALGVAYVLEGSVQRAGGKVRVTAQLIDTRTDAHVWAQRYDRDLSDVFVIQTEVAEAIAAQLQARISPAEKVAMAAPPTKDLIAHEAYQRALMLKDNTRGTINDAELLMQATQLFDAAVARDPAFLAAYAQLAQTHDMIYWFNYDHTEARLALAEAAVQAAERLGPEAGEAKLARGVHLYWGRRDLTAARRELEAARRLLPNNAEVAGFLGLIDRREGRWDDAVQNLRRASELDPRNRNFFFNRLTTCNSLRRWTDAVALIRQNSEILPPDSRRILLAGIEMLAKADPKPLRAAFDAAEAVGPGGARDVSADSFDLAVWERNPATAARALAAIPEAGYTDREGFPSPRAWFAGRLARMRGDAAGAQAAFEIARVDLEKILKAQGETAPALNRLATIDAYLGRRDDAIRGARRACELVPLSRDKIDAPRYLMEAAAVHAILGEKEPALEILAVITSIPGWVSYGELRLSPDWDSLRGDQRFDAAVARLAPKEPIK